MKNNIVKIVIVAVAVITAGVEFAQAQTQASSCPSMQVFLGISPRHRETVMEYIAPKLKAKFGTELVAEVLGSTAMIEKINAQLPNPRVSVAHWDVNIGIVPCAQGLCTPIDFNRAPNAEKLFDGAYSKDANGKPVVLATSVGGVGLMYNEEAFKKNHIAPLTSWKDLERPELKGRISIVSPVNTWGTAALVQWAKMGGGGVDNIEPGFAEVQKLMPAMHTIYTWSSELSNLMQLGEIWVAVAGSTTAPALRAQGMKMKWIAPKEGAPLTNAGVSLVKNSPCEDVAYEYLNLYFSDEYQALHMRESGVTSPKLSAWNLLSPAERKGIDLQVEDFPKLTNFDWTKINSVRPDWIKRWQREVK